MANEKQQSKAPQAKPAVQAASGSAAPKAASKPNAAMTAAEAKAWRASLNKPASANPAQTDAQTREAWRVYWAANKSKYANSASKGLEQFIWLHLKATKNNAPAKFAAGIANFGLKKLAN